MSKRNDSMGKMQPHSLHLSPTLFKIMLRLPPEPRVKPKQQRIPGMGNHGKTTIPFAEIEAWRREYDAGGITTGAMAKKYGVADCQMIRYLMREARVFR